MSVSSVTFALVVYVYCLTVLTATLVWVGNYHPYLPSALGSPFSTIGGIDIGKPSGGGGVSVPTSAFSTIVHNATPLAVFALTHIMMARQWFKDWVTSSRGLYPATVERSMYVLVASVCMHWLMSTWIAMPMVVYAVSDGLLASSLFVLPAIGYLIMCIASVNIDHFHFMGFKQALEINTPMPFSMNGLYSWVRHPLMTGFMLAFWGSPVMTVGRLFFCITNTAFIIFTVFVFEEPNLVNQIGAPYEKYQKTTPSLCPIPWFWATNMKAA